MRSPSSTTWPFTTTSETPSAYWCGVVERGAVAHGRGVEHDEVRPLARPQQAAVGEPEPRAPASSVILRTACSSVSSPFSRT